MLWAMSGSGGGGSGGNGRLAAAQSLQNEHAEALLVQLNEFRKNEQVKCVIRVAESGLMEALLAAWLIDRHALIFTAFDKDFNSV